MKRMAMQPILEKLRCKHATHPFARFGVRWQSEAATPPCPSRGARTVFLALFVFLPTCLGLFITEARADDAYTIVVYEAASTPSPPQLDGNFDEPAWTNAPLASAFSEHGRPERLAGVQTRFRALHDGEALYLAITCDEPEAARLIKPTPPPRDSSDLFGSETIELFLDPAHDHYTYYQVAIGLSEGIFDGQRKDPTWDSTTRAATALDENGWRLEAAIPWTCLDVASPKPGTVIGFNVCRDRLVEEKQWTSWAPIVNGFHNAPLFGHLVIAPAEGAISDLDPAFRLGGRTGPLRITGVRANDAAGYLAEAQALFARMDQLAADTRDEAAKSSAGLTEDLKKQMTELESALDPVRQHIAEGIPLDETTWARFQFELDRLEKEYSTILWDLRLAIVLDRI